MFTLRNHYNLLWIAVLSLSLFAQSPPAAVPDAVQLQRGRLVYRQGRSSEGASIEAWLGNSETKLAAENFPCANCHGITGVGTKEGGLQVPPIHWRALTASYVSPLTGQTRPAYDEARLTTALREGVNSAGEHLHPGMPRYRLSAGQMNDLLAYLRVLGTANDLDPGLSAERIVIGTALPLSGTLATLGQEVQAVVQAYFSELNQQGGIFGRHLDLLVEDSAGEPDRTRAATQILTQKRGVFALLASFEPPSINDSKEVFSADAEAPLLAPLTYSSLSLSPPDPLVFYVIPSQADQARVLVDHLYSAGQTRLAFIAVRNPHAEDAARGVRQQADLHQIKLSEMRYDAGTFSAPKAVAFTRESTAVLFFGGQKELHTFLLEAQQAGLTLPIGSFLLTAGRLPFALPPAATASLHLVSPNLLSADNAPGWQRLQSLQQQAKTSSRYTAFQAVALAGAELLVETLRRSGRQVSRQSFLATLEQIRDFRPSTLPPLTFSPNRHVGLEGACIVRIDATAGQFIAVTDWLVPQTNR